MALEGPLKEFHIQDVFQLLDLGRKSGVLRVTSELRQTSGTVSFDRGGVVAASLANSQPLGARLVRLGKISEQDLDRARALQESGDLRRLGDILVANGVIARRELDRQLKGQIEDTIFQLLGWSEGYFRFEDGAACEAMVEHPVRIPAEALLMEAARRHDEWSRICAWCRSSRLPTLPPPAGWICFRSNGRCWRRLTGNEICTRLPARSDAPSSTSPAPFTPCRPPA